jgi:hypothetical protein
MGKLMIIGKNVLVQSDNRRYKSKVKVKLTKSKNFNSDDIQKLLLHNFEISHLGWMNVTLVLPCDWIVITNGPEKFFIDDKGRIRVKYTRNDITYYTRLNYALCEVKDDDGNIISYNGFIMDSGRELQPIKIDNIFRYHARIESDGNPTLLKKIYDVECLKFMYTNFPMWESVDMYWDIELTSFINV